MCPGMCNKAIGKWTVNWECVTSNWLIRFRKVSDTATSLHGRGLMAVLVCGRSLVLVSRARCQSVIKLLHRARSFIHVLRVSSLQFFVGSIVGVGKLWEIASHLWVADLQGGWVGLQVLWGATMETNDIRARGNLNWNKLNWGNERLGQTDNSHITIFCLSRKCLNNSCKADWAADESTGVEQH